MKTYILCALVVATVAGLPQQRIIGGSQVNIQSYPYTASLLRLNSGSYQHQCGGAIINNRSILTSYNCITRDSPSQWQARLGSSLANSGGTVYAAGSFIIHPSLDTFESDNDVAIIRTQSFITYNANINRIGIAGSGYTIADNTAVTFLGWGAVGYQQAKSEQLLRADLRIINHTECRRNYNIISMAVTTNMICAGNPSTGADFCEGDVGGPLAHNNVLVGIASWRTPVCGRANYPGVFTRINLYSSWIQANG